MSQKILSLTEASRYISDALSGDGRLVSIDRRSVRDFAEALEFEFKPVPSTPNANGLTLQEVKFICKRLKRRKVIPPVAASA